MARESLLSVDPGNANVTFFELNSIFGHDTFLLDVNGVSTALKVSAMLAL